MIVLITIIALGALLLCACGAFAFLMLGIDVIRDWAHDNRTRPATDDMRVTLRKANERARFALNKSEDTQIRLDELEKQVSRIESRDRQ